MAAPDDFSSTVEKATGSPLKSTMIHTFQVNVGYLCNQECHHCHHTAGPHREEVMSEEMMDIIVEKARQAKVQTVDVTGGAPEMNPNIKGFIEKLR